MLRPAAIDQLQRIWAHGGPLNWILRCLALLYGAAVALHRGVYRLGLRRPQQLPVPVIVVGNVVAGGAGKTPTLVAVVTHLRRKGWTVGVVSKGYGRRSRGCLQVLASSQASDVGDEPLLIAKRCQVPVVVADRRLEAARILLQHHPMTQVLVSDDGLQHEELGRDLEVVVFDERGIGNGQLMPAGWLREPWPRRLTSAARMVLQTAPTLAPPPQTQAWTAKRELADWVVNGLGTRQPLQALATQRVVALAGIAKPHVFFSMLAASGVQPVKSIALADHYDFAGWQPPGTDSGLGVEAYICTEKDAVKLWDRHPQIWAVALNLTPEQGFLDTLDGHLNARYPHLQPLYKKPDSNSDS